MKDDVIEPCQVPFVSQILLTPKSNGSFRFCIDFRNLNDISQSMGWPLPNIKQMLERIGRQQPYYFAVVDLTQGYYQCPLAPDSRDFTAFTSFRGSYRWKRVPMGLKGAPSYFQQQMANTVLHGLLYNICELYIDDIIIYGKTLDGFLENVRLVFQRLLEYHITLNPRKCKLGLTQIEYVGHTINRNGIHFSKNKIKEVLDFRKPTTQSEMRSLLGLTGYFRDHIQNYVDIVHPLQEQIKSYAPHKRIKWNLQLDQAYENLKQVIEQVPTMFFMNDTSPVFLETDASDYGIGAFLYQMKDNQKLPVAFISKSLTRAEIKWSTIEKEAFAIFYAFLKLEYLLRDIKFTLRTDHRNLLFINNNNMSKVNRWKMAIQHFNFNVEHVPGVKNQIADKLSRICHHEKVLEGEEVDFIGILGSFDLIKDKERTTDDKVRDIEYFRLDQKVYDTIKRVHNSKIGHHGIERTLKKLQDNNMIESNWKSVRADIKKFLFQCPLCQKMARLKTPIHTHPFTTAAYLPMDRISIDTIGPLPPDNSGFTHIIVIIDCFSRFLECIPTYSTEAITAADALYQWSCRYGVPSQIVSDNGTQYNNSLVKAFCEILGIDMKYIQPYSHEENAIVERAIKEILRHLRAIIYEENTIQNWSKWLPMVCRIINSQPHDVLQISAYELIYGNSINTEEIIINKENYNKVLSALKDSITYQKWIESKFNLFFFFFWKNRNLRVTVQKQA